MEPEPNQHLSAEQLMELVERGQRHKHYSAYIDHIVGCPVCRETYKQLLETEMIARASRSVRKPLGWRWSWGVAIAAAAALVMAVWFLFPRSAPTWQVALHIRDGVAYEGTLRLPEWLANARTLYESPPSVTRSGSNSLPVVVLLTPDPANEGLESLSPQFEWRTVPNAQRIFALLEPISAPSQPIPLEVEGTRATLPKGTLLSRGERYRLRLSASTSPDPLAEESVSTYEFRILTEGELGHLRWARTHAKRAPYASALTFYQLGFYRDALNLLRRQPPDPTTQKWLNALEEQIRQRGGVP